MGAIAAWAGVAIAAGSAAKGMSDNKKAQAANSRAESESKDDYKTRLKKTGEWAKKLQDQYNKVVKQRPNLKWSNYVKEQISQIDDPAVREFYVNAKEEDFTNLQRFADAATTNNTENLLQAAEDISGGKWRDYMDKRDELISHTNAADRFMRANELAAPVMSDASTVRFDEEGRLVEGQRADKQRFNVAYEQQIAAEKEQKQDLSQISNEILSAAQSQQQKATDFMQFFDPTAFSSIISQQNTALKAANQSNNESRAWSLYETFTKAAGNITPTQPTYQDPNPGNQMISDSIKMGTSALTDYYKAQQTSKAATSSTAKTY